MADRFDEMARAFCMEHSLAVDAEVADLLRKVHGEAIEEARKAIVDEWKAANGYDDLLRAYSTAGSELLAARKVVEAARRARISERDSVEVRRADALGRALAEYDQAVKP